VRPKCLESSGGAGLVKRFLAVVVLAIFGGWSSSAFGDGCIFRMFDSTEISGKEPAQTAQQAALFWRAGSETLHLCSNYTGPKADFAWIVPVPTRPTVKESSWKAFGTAEEFTRPRLIIRRSMKMSGPNFLLPGCGMAGGNASEQNTEIESTGVAVVESMNVKEFHVDILVAREGGGLMKWLRDNGYAIPEKASAVLDEYIRASFYFIAVKFDKSQLPSRFGSRSAAALTPLAISFEAPKPFFPLKISSVSSAPENELLLLVVTESPVKPDEYPFVHLTQDDVYCALKAYYAGKSGDADFGSAIRMAQSRSEVPALVLESRLKTIRLGSTPGRGARASRQEIKYDALPEVSSEMSGLGALDGAGADHPSGPYYVSRFHAFLKPQDMKDITFSNTPGDEVRSRFLVKAPADPDVMRVASMPACLLAAGAAGILLSGFLRRGSWLRLLSVLLIFLV